MTGSEPILRIIARVACAAAISMTMTTPAQAGGSVALPDPSGVTLFSLGVAGLLIGRRIASKRRD
jgi:hypothetical protein